MKDSWQSLNERLIGSERYFELDTQTRSLFLTLRRLGRQYVEGTVLDAGAGSMTYRSLLAPLAKRYVSADLRAERVELDVVCDLTCAPFRAGTFDTAVCSQVLEHTPNPQRLLRELARCLRPDGVLLLTAPHISYLHGEPHDYFRYTKYGLAAMLESSGFEVVLVEESGGLPSFLASLVSDVALTGASRIPGALPLAFTVNRAFVRIVCAAERRLHRALPITRLFALNYAVVARRLPTPSVHGDPCDLS
jgi:SAM-dependent methyltransferase